MANQFCVDHQNYIKKQNFYLVLVSYINICSVNVEHLCYELSVCEIYSKKMLHLRKQTKKDSSSIIPFYSRLNLANYSSLMRHVLKLENSWTQLCIKLKKIGVFDRKFLNHFKKSQKQFSNNANTVFPYLVQVDN